MHEKFVDSVLEIVKNDDSILGLLIGGSWIYNEMDEYSDLDFIVVTKNIVSDDLEKMKSFASNAGCLISAFRGDHIGEPRLLVCMYDNPLIHVDYKFVQLNELSNRVEDPAILFDREGSISKLISNTKSEWPIPDFQWFEDRFWTWIHYTATKIGRGELFEAFDAISFMRANVIAPLIQMKNNQLPRGFRKIEMNFSNEEIEKIKTTIASYNRNSIIIALENLIQLYIEFRKLLFSDDIVLNPIAKEKSLEFLNMIKKRT